MKNKSSLKVIIGSAIFACMVGAGGSYAWYSKTAFIKRVENPYDGSVQDEYYASGSGTESDPFIINKPRHLYNLAWLQYLGFYNHSGGTADDHQFYFKLGNNVDMSEFGPIPPIGSELNPFLGNFDGDGYAITNATISNKFSDYKAHPSIISGWNSSTYKQPHILGLFGIIGKYPGCNANTVTNSSANEFTNTAIAGLTVKSDVQDSLMGIAAGYVNDIDLDDNHDVLKNVVVDNSTIDVGNSPAQAYSGGPSENISDYTLVGYTNNSASVIKASKSIYGVNVDTDISYVASSQGQEIGFGGSIGMDELYNRIDSFRGSSVRVPAQINSEYHYFNNGVEDTSKKKTTTINVDSYEYYDETKDLQGRVIYGQTQANYLWGKRSHSYTHTTTNEYHNDDDPKYYYFLSSGYYLYLTGGSANGTQTEANKTKLYEDTDGWIYYKYNNRNYYLYASSTTNGTLRSSTSKQNYMFKVSGSTMRLYKVSDNTSYSRYIQYNKQSYRVNGSSTNFTIDTDFQTTTSTRTDTYDTHGTYLPLNVYKNSSEITDNIRAKLPDENLVVNGAKLNNTGYIVGGTKDMSDGYGSAVRVAKNYSYGDLYRAFGRTSNSSSASYNASSLQILTRTKDSNGVTFISDKYNAETDLPTGLTGLSYVNESNKTKHSISDLGLNVYENARDNLDKQFKASTSTLYVLRFNEFQISLDNTITAEKVLLNGEIKTNYVLPESCIDFNLKQKGFISFFGGGFRGGNCNAFFSLYHLVRNSDDSIKTLKRMVKIYGTNNKRNPYIYEYEDGTYAIYDSESKTYVSTTLLSGYSLHFDLNWVEAPGFTAVDNTMWYFEIPVNEGEYALGAVDGRTGAYMMYLDVGSNAAETNRTAVYEKYSVTESKCNYPVGVSLVSLEDTYSNGVKAISGDDIIDSSDSACMSIKPAVTGMYTMDRNGDTELILERGDQNLAPPIYAYESIDSIHEKNSSEQVRIEAASSHDNIINKMEYYDYDVATNSLTLTSITDEYSNDGTTFENRSIVQKIFTGTDPSVTPDTTYIYDTEKDERSSMKIYNHSATGQAYTSDEMIDKDSLVIDSTKLSNTRIVSYKLKQLNGSDYTEDDVINVVLDTDFDTGTFYKFDNFAITITPASGDMTVQVTDFVSSFDSIVYDVTSDSSSTINVPVILTINGETITGVITLTVSA